MIWSAISLEEAEMETIESFGLPASMVVPSDHHRLDAAAWKHRFPALEVITPPGSRDRTEKVLEVDSTSPDFGDPGVRMVVVPGTGEGLVLLLPFLWADRALLRQVLGPSGFREIGLSRARVGALRSRRRSAIGRTPWPANDGSCPESTRDRHPVNVHATLPCLFRH